MQDRGLEHSEEANMLTDATTPADTLGDALPREMARATGHRIDDSLPVVLMRRYKSLRNDEGYNEEFCRAIKRAAAALSRLRALNAELVAMVERCAGECGNCGGDGRKFVAFNHGEREYDPCDDCADLRTLLERAKGEV